RMSMYFGSQRHFKSVTAAELAALCAWIAFRAGDRVGGLVFRDQQIEQIRPLRSRSRLEALFAAVVRANQRLHASGPDGEDGEQFDKVLRSCVSMAGHDHLVCIISDFAGVTDNTLKLLRQLSAHNDVIALQVYDPIALQLPGTRQVTVTQGSMQMELQVQRRQVNRPLGEFLEGRLSAVSELLRRSQVPLMMINTGEPTFEQVRRELGRLASAAR
ncbi:MAG: DUF58 domain-containing protein, partial [Pseudomonas sp.]